VRAYSPERGRPKSALPPDLFELSRLQGSRSRPTRGATTGFAGEPQSEVDHLPAGARSQRRSRLSIGRVRELGARVLHDPQRFLTELRQAQIGQLRTGIVKAHELSPPLPPTAVLPTARRRHTAYCAGCDPRVLLLGTPIFRAARRSAGAASPCLSCHCSSDQRSLWPCRASHRA